MKKAYVVVGLLIVLFGLSRIRVPKPRRASETILRRDNTYVLKGLFAAASNQPFEMDLPKSGVDPKGFRGFAYGYAPKCDSAKKTDSVRLGEPLPVDLTQPEFEKALNTLPCPEAGKFAIGAVYRDAEKRLTLLWIDETKEIHESKL